ncbi:MAG: DUF1553 domain-containing protein [Pirellulaceae bacterium]|jgi:hypothetical protein
MAYNEVLYGSSTHAAIHLKSASQSTAMPSIAPDTDPPVATQLSASPKRRRGKRLLMCVAVLVALAVVSTTLNSRPRIEEREVAELTVLRSAPDFQQTLATVNQQLAEMAAAAGVETAERADNLTIARRLSLALVGNGMSLEELRAFESKPTQEQLTWWTDYLLTDSRWADYFAERFSRALVGTDNGPFVLFRRRKLNAWLSEQLASGVGYDKIVYEMLSAEGLWTDTPPVNFVTATMDEANEGRGDPIRLAGRTSRALLAQRIDCVQCHDDFIGSLNFGSLDHPVAGSQEHFHSLAAFYAGTALADPVFRGITDDGQPYRIKYLGDSEQSLVEPAVPFSPELLPTEGKPRVRLAAWVTDPGNRAFGRATVNRVWGLMFSRPLVDPVDSIPIDMPVPKVLDALADDWSKHGFQIARLVRMIAVCDAFQRDSRADFEVTEQHEQAWSVFPLTQLRPDQVVGNLLQASKLNAMDSSSSVFRRLEAYGSKQDFLQLFGDRGEDEFESDAVTITQRLIMMNGELAANRTGVDLINNAATRIATLVADDQDAIELIFLTTFNRHPTASETAAFGKELSGKSGDERKRALSDIAWAMVNSTEFSWNH